MNCRRSEYLVRIYNLFLCFLIYSFCGWLIETVYMSVRHGHFIKRGFLISPLCAIYGVGTLLVVYLLEKIKPYPVLIFFSSIIITTGLELITGLLFQKLFNRALWDYSGDSLNFLGIICLRNTLIWGIMSLIAVYYIHPFTIGKISMLSPHSRQLICSTCLVWILADLCISVFTSLHGVNNIQWVSSLIFHRLKDLGNITVKVVYYMRH
ncbi:MAG TPA: putative ABC transporter permease [Ruminiclostridium sp.]|nr:putative ABC transporter permease [Ruminiclostridium sp.]